MSDPRLEELRRRIERDPASIAFAQLAEEHRRLGDYQEAVRICRAGLAQHPVYLSARVTLGRALIELGELEDAARELDYVLCIAPDNLAAIRAVQVIHQRRGLASVQGIPWDIATLDPLSNAIAQLNDLNTNAPNANDPNVSNVPNDPNASVILELETWLSAIVAARERRHSARK
jgi:tetratricopeptide (TPR) repeat protein